MAQPPDFSTVPKRVRYLRECSGLTPYALAELAGLSNTIVYQIETTRGERGIHPSTCGALAKVTGASVAWISRCEGKPPKPSSVTRTIAAACARMNLRIVPGAGTLAPAVAS